MQRTRSLPPLKSFRQKKQCAHQSKISFVINTPAKSNLVAGKKLLLLSEIKLRDLEASSFA